MDASYLLISTLNGLSVGLLLFMLASGLTLIFSMMGVLNFAHASFYMLGPTSQPDRPGRFPRVAAGARRWGCWAHCSSAGAAPRHKFGYVPELLITFGLSYIILELVQLVRAGRLSTSPPAALAGRCSRSSRSRGPGAGLGRQAALCTAAGTICTRSQSSGLRHAVAVLMLIASWCRRAPSAW